MRHRKAGRYIAIVLIVLGTAGCVRAEADVVIGGNLRVIFEGSMDPTILPRGETQGISVQVKGAVKQIGNKRPPGLRRFAIGFNRHAQLSVRGLPVCRRSLISPSTSARALDRCRGSLVGTGHFSAHIDIPDQAPFPSKGRVLVFNSKSHGKPVLLGHVYGKKPIPTGHVLAFHLGREKRGEFGVRLSATLPDVGEAWGYVTGFDLELGREYRFRGGRRQFLAASCPAPAGVTQVPFKLAQGRFYLTDGSERKRVLGGSCRAAT
jgi:hypothetical protein